MTSPRVGVSGWSYPHWRSAFYPAGLPHKLELSYVSRLVNSVEINGSFYSLQRPSSYQQWRQQAPAGFQFSVKGPRFISHMKKLKEVQEPLANFFASGVLALEEQLGPILWQFPANLAYNPQPFQQFLEMLPRDSDQAAQLAAQHSAKVAGDRVYLEAPEPAVVLRHAFEVRHPSFHNAHFYSLLQRHNAALVQADTAGSFPFFSAITADWLYVRLHGSSELYASGYSQTQLDEWASCIRSWQRCPVGQDAGQLPVGIARLPWPPPQADGGGSAGADSAVGAAAARDVVVHEEEEEQLSSSFPAATPSGAAEPGSASSRPVFVYFDNDARGHAPVDAMGLLQRLCPAEAAALPSAEALLQRLGVKAGSRAGAAGRRKRKQSDVAEAGAETR